MGQGHEGGWRARLAGVIAPRFPVMLVAGQARRMMRALVPFGLALLAAPAAAQEPWSFRCPDAGTVARFEPAPTLRYQGTGDAAVLCRMGGQRTPWVLGIAGNEDPLGRAMQETLTGFFPARPGARASLPPRAPSGIGATELTLVGFEAVEAAGRSYQAARIEFSYRRSTERTQRFTAWLDQATGTLLRMIYEDTEGARRFDARAVAIEPP